MTNLRNYAEITDVFIYNEWLICGNKFYFSKYSLEIDQNLYMYIPNAKFNK